MKIKNLILSTVVLSILTGFSFTHTKANAKVRYYRTSIIHVQRPNKKIRHKIYKNHLMRHKKTSNKVQKIKIRNAYKHHVHIKLKRIKRVKLHTAFQSYQFKHSYKVITAEPVREFKNIAFTSNTVIPINKQLYVKRAIYKRGHKSPFGFELTNKEYIPSYAVVYA